MNLLDLEPVIWDWEDCNRFQEPRGETHPTQITTGKKQSNSWSFSQLRVGNVFQTTQESRAEETLLLLETLRAGASWRKRGAARRESVAKGGLRSLEILED